MVSEVNTLEYLKEDNNNIVFIFNNKASGYIRSELKKEYTDRSRIEYECKGKFGISIRKENVHFDKPYFRLQLHFGTFLINADNFLAKVILSKRRIFLLNFVSKLGYSASFMSIGDATGERTLDGRVLNIVGRDHCSDGTEKHVFELSVISYESYGGKKTKKRVLKRRKNKKSIRSY